MMNDCDVPIPKNQGGELRSDGMFNETDWMLIHYYHSVFTVLHDLAPLFEKHGEAREYLEQELLPDVKSLLMRMRKLNMLSRRDGGFTCEKNAVSRYVPHKGSLFIY